MSEGDKEKDIEKDKKDGEKECPPILLEPKKDSKIKATVFAHAKKGAKQHQEDSFYCWKSPNDKVLVGGVWDGHGGYNGYLASSTARDVCSEYLAKVGEFCESWTADEWKENLTTLFETMHWAIRDKFLHDPSQALSPSGGRRYLDDKSIVRSASGDPIHGGTTASITAVVLSDAKNRFVVTANVGDSTGLLLPSDGKEKWEFLTVDHGPENQDEWARVNALDSEAYPKKLLFVYDKTSIFRKYECPPVFLESGKKDPKFISNPWGNGLHPTNVRYEPAVYAVTPKSVTKDSTCIAMTRALGDFYAHQFGLTSRPDVRIKSLKPNVNYNAILASDGVWDCWKYGEFMDFFNGLITKGKTPIEAAQLILTESVQRAITNFGAKHFDDAALVALSFPLSPEIEDEKEKETEKDKTEKDKTEKDKTEKDKETV